MPASHLMNECVYIYISKQMGSIAQPRGKDPTPISGSFIEIGLLNKVSPKARPIFSAQNWQSLLCSRNMYSDHCALSN